MEFSEKLRLLATRERKGMAVELPRIGFVDDALSAKQVSALSSLFPDIAFQSVGATWPERYTAAIDILFVSTDSSLPQDVDAAVHRLRARPSSVQIVVMLQNADVANSRALAHAGAADVLSVPVSDASLALCVERLLTRSTADRGWDRKRSQVVGLLKAGGGVGATSLGVQVTNLLADRTAEPAQICFADLDLQFGNAALYFDLSEGVSITDCLAVGDLLADMQFATVLTAQASGARVLAGPRELTALDALTPAMAESLITGLRRNFALAILDLPSVWTAWTDRILQVVDRLVLVTQLSVPHVHLVRRQLAVLALQKLDELPLTLVCNNVTSERQSMLSLKSAERSIGRPFDIIVPGDSRVMDAAVNEGKKLSAIRYGTKLEKAVGLLADAIAANALAQSPKLSSRM